MRSAAIQPIRHNAHGEGLSFPLLVSHGQVDVFPAVGVTCVTLANVHIELFRRAAPQAWEDQVLFPSASAADEASLSAAIMIRYMLWPSVPMATP